MRRHWTPAAKPVVDKELGRLIMCWLRVLKPGVLKIPIINEVLDRWAHGDGAAMVPEINARNANTPVPLSPELEIDGLILQRDTPTF